MQAMSQDGRCVPADSDSSGRLDLMRGKSSGLNRPWKSSMLPTDRTDRVAVVGHFKCTKDCFGPAAGCACCQYCTAILSAISTAVEPLSE